MAERVVVKVDCDAAFVDQLNDFVHRFLNDPASMGISDPARANMRVTAELHYTADGSDTVVDQLKDAVVVSLCLDVERDGKPAERVVLNEDVPR